MVGDKIKEYRLLRGLSQIELSNRMGVSQKTISSWEIGRTEPNMGSVEKLAACLECRKSDLIGDEEVTEALSPKELHLVILFRQLSEVQQDMIIHVAEVARREG